MLSADEQGGPQGPQGEPTAIVIGNADTHETVSRMLVLEADLARVTAERDRLKAELKGPYVMVRLPSVAHFLSYLDGKEGLRMEVVTQDFPPHCVKFLLERAVAVAGENGLDLPEEG